MQRPYHKLIPLISLIVIVVGFVDTLVEVDESFGQATLYVNISFPPPDQTLQIGITFTLVVNTMDGSAGMGDGSLHVFSMIIVCVLFRVQDHDLPVLPSLLGFMIINRF